MGSDPFGHRQRGARGHGFDPERLRHFEAVDDILIFHVVVHVVAEQVNIDAGVVPLFANGLSIGFSGRRRERHLTQFFLDAPAAAACCSGVRGVAATHRGGLRAGRLARRVEAPSLQSAVVHRPLEPVQRAALHRELRQIAADLAPRPLPPPPPNPPAAWPVRPQALRSGSTLARLHRGRCPHTPG